MSSKTDIWMPVYIGDYLRDTQHLSTEEHGAYFLLLMHGWTTGPLPNNPEMLRRIARVGDHAAWSSIWSVLRAFYQLNDEGLLYQARQERERLASAEKKAKAVEKARNAALGRYGKDASCTPASNAPSSAASTSSSMLQEVLEQCPSPSPSPSPTLIPKNKKNTHKASAAGAAVCEDFRSLWNETCGPQFAQVQKLTSSREAKVKSRIGEGIDLEKFRQAVAICNATPFLRGESDRGWVASFDWLFKTDSQIVKVLEGHYGETEVQKEPVVYEAITWDEAYGGVLTGTEHA